MPFAYPALPGSHLPTRRFAAEKQASGHLASRSGVPRTLFNKCRNNLAAFRAALEAFATVVSTWLLS
jgi:hypothetical protein